MSEFATVADLARRYRVSPGTVREWARKGLIPYLRAGKRPLLFDVDKVDRALEERAREEVAAR